MASGVEERTPVLATPEAVLQVAARSEPRRVRIEERSTDVRLLAGLLGWRLEEDGSWEVTRAVGRADQDAQLHVAGSVLERAWGDVPGVSAVGPADAAALATRTPLVHDPTPSGRWAAALADVDAIEVSVPAVAFDPRHELWRPAAGPIVHVTLGHGGAGEALAVAPGFGIAEVRSAFRCVVPAEVLPVLLVDRSRLTSDLDVAIAVGAGASLGIPVELVGAPPDGYLGPRTASVVASIEVRDVASWYAAASALRVAALRELARPWPLDRPETQIPDGRSVVVLVEQALLSGRGWWDHPEAAVIALGEHERSLGDPRRDAQVARSIEELQIALASMPDATVMLGSERVEGMGSGTAAPVACAWAAGAPVLLGAARVAVPEHGVAIGGPLQVSDPGLVAASSASVLVALRATGRRSLDAAFRWLMRQATYLPTLEAGLRVAPGELVTLLGSVLGDRPQWGVEATEESA